MSIWSAEIQKLETLFNSIEGRFPDLGKELERLIKADDENMLLLYSRRCLEVIITDLCECELKRLRGTEPLKGIIDKLNKERKVPSHILSSMHGLNELSTYGAHPKDFDPEQVKPVLVNLEVILRWYLKYKGFDNITQIVEDKVTQSEVHKEFRHEKGVIKPEKVIRLNRPNYLVWIVSIIVIIVLIGFYAYPKLFKGSGKTIVEKSVALMPFKNLTGEISNDFLADMQHEALYQELGKISQVKPLRIVGPVTSATFERNRLSVSKFARDANVEYLIEGSVLSSGVVQEIMVRMIQILPEERLVWANNYTTDRKNILKLYNSIALLIAQKIGLDLLPPDQVKLPKPQLVNPQSFEAYVRGMSELEKSTEDGMKKGLEYLRESVNSAPEDPFANAGFALGYLTIAHSALDPGNALEKGEEFALKSLMLDSTKAEVHAALAIAYLYKSWKFAESEKHFKRALELNPNLDMAHYHYAWGLFLWGRMDEAIAEHKLAQKYDPYNPLHTAWLGELYNYAGRYEEAVQVALKSLEIQKDYPIGYLVLGRAYLNMDRNDEAIKIHQKLAELYPAQLNALCLTYIETGHREEAEEILKIIEKRDVTPANAYHRALIYASLGIKDEAFKWLNYEPHHAFVAWAAVTKYFKPLHGDPRWDEFLKRLNLPKN